MARRAFARRHGFRGMVLAGWLAAIAVVFVATASGSTSTVKPYTAYFSPTLTAGSTVDLVLTNHSDQQSLGSADVTAAKLGSTSFTMTATSLGTIKSSGSLLELRNLGIAPGTSRTITITVAIPCLAGDYTWGIRAKQSNNFSGPPGNDFSLRLEGSNLVTSVSGGCRLEWVTEPASALKDALITGADFDPTGAKVAVRAIDGGGDTLTALNSGAVTLTKTAGPTASFTGTSATFVAGVATFDALKSGTSGVGFKLTASSPGFVDTRESGAFDILLSTTACTTSGCETDPLNVNGFSVQAQTSSDNFLLIGIGVLDIGVPEGCGSFVPLGNAPIVVTDSRSSLAGDIFVTYGIKKRDIQKRYGSNSGEQFIPICAGAKRLTLNAEGKTVPVHCSDSIVYGEQTGWKAKPLDANGKFDLSAPLVNALCDPVTGYFFGILGSFQDYTNSDPAKQIDPGTNPTVVGWNSDNTYRYFITKFSSGSGPGALATVPWDGWKFG